MSISLMMVDWMKGDEKENPAFIEGEEGPFQQRSILAVHLNVQCFSPSYCFLMLALEIEGTRLTPYLLLCFPRISTLHVFGAQQQSLF